MIYALLEGMDATAIPELELADIGLWRDCSPEEQSAILWDVCQYSKRSTEGPIDIAYPVRPMHGSRTDAAKRMLDRLCILGRPAWQFFGDLHVNEQRALGLPAVPTSPDSVPNDKPSNARLSVTDRFAIAALIESRESGESIIPSVKAQTRYEQLYQRALRNPAHYVRNLETHSPKMAELVSEASGRTPHTFKLTTAGIAYAESLEQQHFKKPAQVAS